MTDRLPSGPKGFHTTHWSLVSAAKTGADQTRARQALEELSRLYWYPLYAFVRHRGHPPDEAQDLTQAFFLRILETQGLASADSKRGRFRSYLLGAMKNFLANQWHRDRALKRGGAATILELDALEPEARYALEPTWSDDPDAGFDREWALECTTHAIVQLRTESIESGKGALFDALKGSLTGTEPARTETAEQLGMTEGAVKVAVHRLRQRYREILRTQIAKTVADPAEIDDELQHLADTLRRQSGIGS